MSKKYSNLFKKGSMELSVNSIVILVIAIVMLGLILGFVKSKFSSLDNQLVQNEAEAPAASASEQVTISRAEIVTSSGEELGLKFQVYATSELAAAKPFISCGGSQTDPTVTINANTKPIPANQIAKYEAVVKIIGSKGKYVCTLGGLDGDTVLSFEKDLLVTIK